MMQTSLKAFTVAALICAGMLSLPSPAKAGWGCGWGCGWGPWARRLRRWRPRRQSTSGPTGLCRTAGLWPRCLWTASLVARLVQLLRPALP
jgi:hypothetical protein